MFGPSTHARGVSDGNRSVTGAGRAFERLPSNSIPYWRPACDALIAGGESFALHLDAMTDEQLAERVALPNTSKSRKEMLLGVKTRACSLRPFHQREERAMSTPAKNTICLWYDGGAEDAARFYAG